MSEHFSAFSFVDRITQVEPGKRARGHYLVPAGIRRFPVSFALEAAGQLAAWTAMAQFDFQVRPVAGLAGDLRFGRDVRPGQTLDLAVEIETCEDDAVSYCARAEVDGEFVVEIDHSVGPFLPMEEFDSADAVRERFELITGPGAPAERFEGVAEHDLEVVELARGERIVAAMRVPEAAPFFLDHFPRRPVLPATILLDAQIQLSLQLATASQTWPPDAKLFATGVPEMKMRSFIPPGEVLELSVEFTHPGGANGRARTGVRMNGKSIARGLIEIASRTGE
jgi:3-hydroxymyristoyl/3-hydroxydecanoyl-(acyl carrier protein) dehydratase